MKRGFTLIELLVVIAMLVILMAAMTTSVAQARKRAKVARATQEVKEMTNAILAYENYARNHSLQDEVTGGWVECTKGKMSMILGGRKGDNGEDIPVLYNAIVKGSNITDPWGHAYRYNIQNTGTQQNGEGSGKEDAKFVTAPVLPNFFRLTDGERRARQ